MNDQDPTPEPESGIATSPDAEPDGTVEVEYVRRSFYLPRPLVERLEAEARETDGDSSRILAEALGRHLGGSTPASSATEAAPPTGDTASGGSPATGAVTTPYPDSDAAPPGTSGKAGAGPATSEGPAPTAPATGSEPPETPRPTSPTAAAATGESVPSEPPAPDADQPGPGAEPEPLDLSEELLDDEAHDLAESLYARLSLLGDVSLHAPPVRETLQSVSRVIEGRDAFSGGHAAGVGALARGVAETMDLPSGDVLAIELGGLAHELGKLAVPRSILSKKGKLTAAERETMRRYPEVAARLLRSIPVLRPLEPIVLHHQERWDGSGYPAGLAGDDIPVGAQIVGVADAYHALTSARSYRPALDSDRARNTVREASGRLWNPRVASALIRYVESRD